MWYRVSKSQLSWHAPIQTPTIFSLSQITVNGKCNKPQEMN